MGRSSVWVEWDIFTWLTVISVYSEVTASSLSVETASWNTTTTHCANSPSVVKLQGYSQFKKWTSHVAISPRSMGAVNEKQGLKSMEAEVSLQKCFQHQTCKMAVEDSVLIYSLSKQKFSPVKIIYSMMQYTQLWKHRALLFFLWKWYTKVQLQFV